MSMHYLLACKRVTNTSYNVNVLNGSSFPIFFYEKIGKSRTLSFSTTLSRVTGLEKKTVDRNLQSEPSYTPH